MKYSSFNRGFVAGNPIANVFVVIVGVLAISISIVLGFFAFVVLGSIVLIMAAMVGIRVWWFKRQLRGAVPPNAAAGPNKSTGGVIEGEYRVVADERRDE